MTVASTDIRPELLPEYTFSERPGLVSLPALGSDTIAAWLWLVNEGDDTHRVSAFIVLLDLELRLEVKRRGKT